MIGSFLILRLLILSLIAGGYRLASGSQDGTIKLWDVKTGECLKTPRTNCPYEGMNRTCVTGLTQVAIATLEALGAVESVVSP